MVDTVYPCPLCGRTVNRQGTPFTDPSQTMSHINGAHDARHKNESGEDYAEEVQENAEELDEAVGQLAEDNEPIGPESDEPTVDIEELGGEIAVSEAVTDAFELASLAFENAEDGASAGPVAALEETVEQQQEQIGELYEQFEELVEQLDGTVEFDHAPGDGAAPSPGDIYDPTEDME